ncbi:helix-turn-helix transcriptional regulator [Nocardiopsis sp. NPDC049922]|uniref:helix-turn-helix domain-containing protein n=1 Tax=Nocardiopsis sp. NPDC049922 TaxID=3155157 RepID=UPI0033DCAD8D
MKRPVRPHALRWGTELRKYRTTRGKTQVQVARHIRVSGGLVSGFEVGTHWPSLDKVEATDTYLRAGGKLLELWVELTNSQAYPDWLGVLVKAEKVTTRIRSFEALAVPGLVQTESYAKALVRASNPLETSEKVTEMVAGRLKRQRLWDMPEAPQMLTVINEWVLLSPTGGAQVMVEQIDRLIELVESHKIALQVVPLDTRFHPGSTGSFVLLSFRDRPDALYVEDAFTGRMVHEAGKVEQAQDAFGHLQGVAHSLDRSLKRLYEVKRSHQDGSLDMG